MKGRRQYQHTVDYVTGEIVSSRRIPTRQQNIQSDFAVPALVGFLLGIWGGLIVGLLAYMIFDIFWLPFAIFALTFSLVGFIWRLQCTDATIWATEQVARSQGQQDPYKALPMPEVKPPVLLNPYTGRERAEAEQKNADQEAFAAFVRECEFGSTSYAKWRSEPNYAIWRDKLIDSGWASWNNENEHRAGWKLNANADAERIIEALNG